MKLPTKREKFVKIAKGIRPHFKIEWNFQCRRGCLHSCEC